MSYSSDLHDDDVLAGKDHELTLSTAAIFGIFFGLVALCAVFFGFGYSLGSHKSPTVLPADTATGSSPSANFSSFKPAAGQPAGSTPPRPTPVQAATDTFASSRDDSASESAPPPAPIVRTPAAQPVPVATPRQTAPATQPPAPIAATVASAGLFVQVAAISVSHPDDATLMVNALRAKGYAANTHPAADNFIHVLIGPIATRPAAEAMLKRLSADGYTAYIK